MHAYPWTFNYPRFGAYNSRYIKSKDHESISRISVDHCSLHRFTSCLGPNESKPHDTLHFSLKMSIKIKYAIHNTTFNGQDLEVPYCWRIQDLIDHLCLEKGFKSLMPIKNKAAQYLRPGQYISLYSKELEDAVALMKPPMPDLGLYPYVSFRMHHPGHEPMLCIGKLIGKDIIKLLKPMILEPHRSPSYYLRLGPSGRIGILSIRHPWYEDTLLHYGSQEPTLDVKDDIHWSPESPGECIICLTSKANMYLYCDTHHISVCDACAERLTRCPTCRSTIYTKVKVEPLDQVWNLGVDLVDAKDALTIEAEIYGLQMAGQDPGEDAGGKLLPMEISKT